MHQVSAVHTRKLCDLLGVDMALVPLTYPGSEHGTGGGAVHAVDGGRRHREGERVLLMGIGSGLNCAAAELIW